MSEVPQDVRAMAREREEARRGKDFATADALRRRIHEAGYEVTDTPSGPRLARRAPDEQPMYTRSQDVPSRLDESAEDRGVSASVQWVVQGWPEDVDRGIRSLRASDGVDRVVVDAADLGRTQEEWGVDDLVRMAPEAGWAAARNAALRRSVGEIVIVVDGSIEFTGDCVNELRRALQDPSVGLTGPFGLVSDDLHEFREPDGPDVDAVEGYVMAFRRELVQRGLRFDEKFKFYRNADIELSFQIKAMGLRVTVTPLPLVRHEHRMWAHTPEDQRERLSKRNFYRFLDRWRGRTDLLVNAREG